MRQTPRAPLQLTQVAARRVPTSAYRRFVAPGLLDEVHELAHAARGMRVVHVSSTAAGGGVAELLHSVVPLSRGVGIDASWYVLPPDGPFFNVTKRLHNCLQGSPGLLGQQRLSTYVNHLEQVSAAMAGMRADVWVVHDPQPLPLASMVPLKGGTIWRCHIDCSAPNRRVSEELKPWMRNYDRAVFSIPTFRVPGLEAEQIAVEAPAIDPLSIKNRPLARRRAQHMLARLGIDPARPLVTQIARFDPWKDHAQAVEAYRLAKRAIPDLQLALVGTFTAKDDPEAPTVYRAVRELVADEPDVHLYTDASAVDATAINAFQVVSDVILQRSLREGFGLTVTEAMWKGRPVIARPVGGISSQIEHERSGLLVSSAEECGEHIVSLVRDRGRARRIGAAARRRVRSEFLMPRLLRDELRLYLQVAGARGRQEVVSAKAAD